jgi:hypothetical protein
MDSKAIAGYRAVERLQDGGSVTIRAIRPEDKAGLIDALERVSAESLYTRFFSGKQEFSDAEMTRMVRVDFGNVVALVAVLEDEGADQDRRRGALFQARSSRLRAERGGRVHGRRRPPGTRDRITPAEASGDHCPCFRHRPVRGRGPSIELRHARCVRAQRALRGQNHIAGQRASDDHAGSAIGETALHARQCCIAAIPQRDTPLSVGGMGRTACIDGLRGGPEQRFARPGTGGSRSLPLHTSRMP